MFGDLDMGKFNPTSDIFIVMEEQTKWYAAKLMRYKLYITRHKLGFLINLALDMISQTQQNSTNPWTSWVFALT